MTGPAIAVDTNVLVRLLVQDDPIQTESARRLLQRAIDAGEALIVMLCALLETEWVLRSRYRFGKAGISAAFMQLLRTRGLTLEHEASIEEALWTWDQNPAADFTDCLLSAHALRLGASRFVTFDHRAARLPGATLLE